jgi:3-hydroxyisobutyrate dehydrogenase-like beta-hydroxyacid dehydrogenase
MTDGSPRRLGFIGLGKMGYAMTRNLLRHGFAVTVYDVLPEAIDRVIPFEASPAASPREVGERSEAVITMVPADRDVEVAVLGPDGALAGLRPGSTLIQMSTIKPSTIQKLAPEAAARGVRLIDAPVSMGQFVAEGKLSIMVGGDPAVFEQCRPIFEALGTDIFHVGELGAGQAIKLVNNYMSMAVAVVAAEGLLLGLKAGLASEVLHEVVLKGSGSSVAWRDKVPMMLAHDFYPDMTFTTDLAYKDLSLAIESANELQTPVMLGGLARELYNAARLSGLGSAHYASVVRVLEKMAGIQADREGRS